jgi:hypothetical protein
MMLYEVDDFAVDAVAVVLNERMQHAMVCGAWGMRGSLPDLTRSHILQLAVVAAGTRRLPGVVKDSEAGSLFVRVYFGMRMGHEKSPIYGQFECREVRT